MQVGFIGAGAMGAPMIARLSANFPGNVMVFDTHEVTKHRVATETGAIPMNSIADIAAKSDFLLSCVPNNDSIRQVYLGEGGVVTALREGSVTIDCSTVGPDATRAVHGALKAIGSSHLDASMLGSVKQANDGTISFVVGGDKDAFDRALPVLSACGQMIRYCGPLKESGN